MLRIAKMLQDVNQLLSIYINICIFYHICQCMVSHVQSHNVCLMIYCPLHSDLHECFIHVLQYHQPLFVKLCSSNWIRSSCKISDRVYLVAINKPRQPRWLSGLKRSRVHSLIIALRSLCPEKLGSNPAQGSKGINFSGWHGLDMSVTVTKRR